MAFPLTYLIATVVFAAVLGFALGKMRSDRTLDVEKTIAQDLQERRRREERNLALAEASRILESSLEYETTFQELMHFLSKTVCERAAAMVHDEEGSKRFASSDEAERMLTNSTFSECVESVIKTAVTQTTSIGVHRVVFVAVPTPSAVSGVLAIAIGQRSIDPETVLLFEEMGRRAGVAFEHARLYRRAQEINRLKDEFVAVASHELRTPLTPILGAVYMLKSEPGNPTIFNRALDLIERNAKAQSRIVEDLLDASRMISGKLRLNMDGVDLPGVVLAAVEMARPSAEANKINLEADIRPLRGVVYGDAERLQQVVWKLLANSVKFTPAGGRITVELEEKDRCAALRVCDTGRGIAPEFLPHVFDSFRQGDGSRTRSQSGLGLGLAIARGLVESHGGTIQAASSGDRQGSTFTVTLPLRHVAEAAHA